MIVLQTQDGRSLKAYKTKQPKMAFHRGRCWDYETKNVNGQVVKFYADFGWGRMFYFAWDKIWYKVDMADIPDGYNAKLSIAEPK